MNLKIDYEEKIEELLAQLTLKEKTGMLHGAGLFRTEGVERLSIPPVRFSDGPMGVRQEFQNDRWITVDHNDDFVTYLPSNSAIASAWDREIAREIGRILGEEARGRGKDMILAPGINIKRSPLCGRNFEYLSEDPRLVEELVVPLIQGIQENDVAACVKHFAANSQETDRLMVDTRVDERTLRELYLPGFRAAVQRAGSLSIMGAYNKLNGEHCCENKRLLDEILREEWGFDGTVVSDWNAVHRTREAAECSLDMEMSVTDNFDQYMLADPLIEAVQKGEISEEYINDKIRNILRMMFRLKMIGEEKESRRSGAYNTPEHREGAYQAAVNSVILLKNEEELLPLRVKQGKRIAVIGQNAVRIHAAGGGSAEIKALYEISPLLGLKMRLGGNVETEYAPGYYIPDKEDEGEENWQKDSINLEAPVREALDPAKKKEYEERGRLLLEEAVALARNCDQVIFVGGLDHDIDVEGQDRSSMKLPYGQEELIRALFEVNPDTVLVFVAGSPVEMPFLPQAKAILWSYYAGMETGTAIADVLLGVVNPSGKLAETFPCSYADTPTAENGQFALRNTVEYQEGILVGYRYYEKKKKKTAFCFGHGLSYTRFEYRDLQISVVGEQEDISICLKVKNIGQREGKEIVQLYVGEDQPALLRPVKELKAFEKISLKPGEEKEISFTLTGKDLGYYREEDKSFFADKGSYTVYAAASLEDVRLTGKLVRTKEYHYL